MDNDLVIQGIRHEIGRSGLKSPPDGAHIVDDYPWGFRLKCRQAYWLETARSGAKAGETRRVTCTTNPKTGNVHWNAPKPGNYSDVVILYIKGDRWGAEAGHVGTDSLHLNSDPWEVDAFEARWGDQLKDHERDRIKIIRAWHTKMSKVTWTTNGVPQVKSIPTDSELSGVIPDAETMAERVKGIAADHAEAYRFTLDDAGRMAWNIGKSCLVIYSPIHRESVFNAYPDSPSLRKKIAEYPASYSVVASVDPPTVSDPVGPKDDRPLPGSAALSGIDWITLIPELDATEPFEMNGRTVKMLELCTDLDEPPDSVVQLARQEASDRGLTYIVEPSGHYVLRDLGPIPPDVEDEDEPTDRADDDGMAHPDVPVPWTPPRFKAGDRVEVQTGGFWLEGTISIVSRLETEPGFRRYSVKLDDGREIDWLKPLEVRAAATDPIDRAPQPVKVDRPWLEPIPTAPLALMPPRGKLLVPRDILLMLDDLPDHF